MSYLEFTVLIYLIISYSVALATNNVRPTIHHLNALNDLSIDAHLDRAIEITAAHYLVHGGNNKAAKSHKLRDSLIKELSMKFTEMTN